MRAARSDQTTWDKPLTQGSSATRRARPRPSRPATAAGLGDRGVPRSGGCRGLQLRAAGTEGPEALVETGPRPGLNLTVPRNRLVPGRLEVLEPGVRLLDLEQLLRLSYRSGGCVVVIVHGPDRRTRVGRRCTLGLVSDDRYDRGWERLRELAGEHGERV